MPSFRLRFFALANLLFLSLGLFAQTDTVLFTPVSEFRFPAPYSCYTARFDRLHRPFIFTANKELGLGIYDYSDLQNLQSIRNFSVQNFQNLKPTDLVQQGNFLYVALGDFEGFFPQSAGLAVLDISDPANATILGQWSDTSFNKGCAALRVEGNYAYLGAMEKGVILVDISNPAAPKYLSHVELDLNWPAPPGLFSVPHARGFALRSDELWTCFDAGWLRLVDVSDKQNPIETAKYLNPDLNATAQPAYNNAVVVGDYLYVAVDYCGIDIVDISNPAIPVNAAWENPWACNNTNWADRPGHTNQITTACNDSLLFVSGADSEVLAYSIVNPNQPRRLGQHAVLLDSVATWGIDVNDSLVVLAQLWNPLNTPYLAKKGGIRLLRWSCPQASTGIANAGSAPALFIWPNPFRDQLKVRFELPVSAAISWSLVDMFGRSVRSAAPGHLPAGEQVLDLALVGLPAGMYAFVMLVDGQEVRRLVVRGY